MLKRASRAPDPDTFFAGRFNGLWASIQGDRRISYLASTVYDAQCDRIRDRIQGICQHHDVERLKTGVTLPQRTQRGWGLKLPAPSLHAQNAKCSSTPGSRRGRRRAPRGRRRPPRSARTGAAATQFGPPARHAASARAQRRTEGFHSVEHQACILTHG